MRFCGNCGAPLNASVLSTGRCAACGARVTFSGDLIETDTSPRTYALPNASAAEPPAPHEGATLPGGPLYTAPTDPRTEPDGAQRMRWTAMGAMRTDQTRRSRTLALSVVAAGALVAVSVLAAALLFTGHTPTSGGLGGIGVGAAPHATATATATGRPQRTATPGAPTTTIVLTAQPITTVTVTGPAPVLAVSPTTINAAPCGVTRSATITVSNTGGGSLAWSYMPPLEDLYTLSPSHGTLGAGQSQTVTISLITHAGTVSISAPSAAGSPQVVTVSCG